VRPSFAWDDLIVAREKRFFNRNANKSLKKGKLCLKTERYAKNVKRMGIENFAWMRYNGIVTLQ
jgi:hypothetical protein